MSDLFFVTSKLFWNVFNPVQLLFVLLASGLVLCFTRWRRLGIRMALLFGLVILLLGIFPVGKWIAFPLEQQFAAAVPPEKIEGIVILGGAYLKNPERNIKNQAVMRKYLRRYSQALTFLRRYPAVPVIFTGFSGQLLPDGLNESEIAEVFFGREGENGRIVYENRARNTYENAIYSKKIARNRLHQPWLLITSAIHMPRSVGVFRKVGWTVIPAPVDYIKDRSLIPHPGRMPVTRFLSNLLRFNTSTKEWLGLLAYYLTGKTDELFPD